MFVTRRKSAASARARDGFAASEAIAAAAVRRPPAQPGTNRESRDPATGAVAVEQEALVVTGWFDSGEGGVSYSATVRFTGRRIGYHGMPRARDAFTQEEVIDHVLPGTGPVSITTWVYGLEPGEWSVRADLMRVATDAGEAGRPARSRPITSRPVRPAGWSWRRWALTTEPETTIKTRWARLAPLARIPAVLPGSYPILAILGTFVALAIQSVILGNEGVNVSRSLVVSLLAIAAGLVGAKLWYAALHPDESRIKGGWAVDGFLVVAPVMAVAAMLMLGVPIGAFLDASTPGLFFAVAIGRIGCFLTGCCAGRATTSRWGVWSSDRRVGARRIPAQLVESAAGLVIGAASLLPVLREAQPVHGFIFVAAVAAYAIVRQVLLRARAEQRRSSRSLPLTAGAVAIVLVLVAAISHAQAIGTPLLGAVSLDSHGNRGTAAQARSRSVTSSANSKSGLI